MRYASTHPRSQHSLTQLHSAYNHSYSGTLLHPPNRCAHSLTQMCFHIARLTLTPTLKVLTDRLTQRLYSHLEIYSYKPKPQCSVTLTETGSHVLTLKLTYTSDSETLSHTPIITHTYSPSQTTHALTLLLTPTLVHVPTQLLKDMLPQSTFILILTYRQATLYV